MELSDLQVGGTPFLKREENMICLVRNDHGGLMNPALEIHL